MMKYRYLSDEEKRQIARQILKNMTLDDIELLLIIVEEYLNIQQRTENILRKVATITGRTTPTRRTLEDIVAQLVEKEMEKREKITPPPEEIELEEEEETEEEEIEKREQERTQFRQELRNLIERIRQEKTIQEQKKLKQDLETLKRYGVLDKQEYEELKKKLKLEEETKEETEEKENQKTG